jgi:hypothetical protein
MENTSTCKDPGFSMETSSTVITHTLARVHYVVELIPGDTPLLNAIWE